MWQLEEEECPLEVRVACVEALATLAAASRCGAALVLTRSCNLHPALVQAALGASTPVSLQHPPLLCLPVILGW